jgi:lysozyme
MTYTPGIDVSHWQAQIDWQKVSTAGKRFAFIKATERNNFIDDQFELNWAQAKAAGLVRGAYHFFRPLVDAAEQADLALSIVHLEEGDLPLALDLETGGNIKASTMIQRVEVWVKRVEDRTGHKPILYSNPSWLNTYFQISAGGPPLWAYDHMLWLANYVDPGVTQPLIMPTGWKKWTFWQHSATGSVDGIQGNVDLDWFDGTEEELLILAGRTGGGIQFYTVQPGDTLLSICGQLNIELQKLVEANPQFLKEGDRIRIPAGNP